MDSGPTHLTFQHDGDITTLPTKVVSVRPASSLDEADKPLFKQVMPDDHVIVTTETIFHPQGGGQPSDIGTMIATAGSEATFEVTAARMSISQPGVVLHLGQFKPTDQIFGHDDAVVQHVDEEKRLLFSRYHTAGHVLGAAVRHLLEGQVDGFDELKASHFPDSASCEFAGLIAGTHKEAIQTRTDEYIKKDMAVEIDWWDEDDFKREGYERLIPDRKLLSPGETKFRIVRIVGAEVYPCGGTHVHTTSKCGRTTVKKISRQKGTSKVSYSVA